MNSESVIHTESTFVHLTGMLYGVRPPIQLGVAVAYQDVRNNERFAGLVEQHKITYTSAALAVERGLRIPDIAEDVDPDGGAIALGHPLGASGARLALTAAMELDDRGGRRALATICIGRRTGHCRPARIRMTALSTARITFADAAEIVDSCHIRPKTSNIDPRSRR